MSFEMGFLFVCLSLLGAFIVVLTISTVIMGSRTLLRLQHMFNSLKYNKEIDDIIQRTLAKVEAGLLIAKLHDDKEIRFYTDDELKQRIDAGTDRWGDRLNTHKITIWVGNKFTQYGVLKMYHDKRSYEMEGMCGSYKTFRAILALEDKLSGRTAEVKKEEAPKKKGKEIVELD